MASPLTCLLCVVVVVDPSFSLILLYDKFLNPFEISCTCSDELDCLFLMDISPRVINEKKSDFLFFIYIYKILLL